MKTVQAQRSVEMENVVNHTWAKPLVGMSQASILKNHSIARMLPLLAPITSYYVPLIAHSLNYKTSRHHNLQL
jgi:hypothetical protein